MNAVPLNSKTVQGLGDKLVFQARAPGVQAGVVHLGLGGFHRAHQAMVFDALISNGDLRWGVCAVGMRNPALSEQLQAQDGLYLVRVSDASGSYWCAPAAIVKTLVAASEREALLAQVADRQTRWITLTVTEKAYTPALAQLLVDALAGRMSQGQGGLTIASCDNVPGNGHVLRALCLAEAKRRDGVLANWIETQCRFPASMVDRIVPAPSPAVTEAAHAALGLDDPTALGVERFWEWVIEDQFVDPSDAQALRSVGVVVTDDVLGYEQAKLWMLNSTNTLLSSIGSVLGDSYIRQVIARPLVREFVYRIMSQASGPLVGRPAWQAYRDALIERFGNPGLDHGVAQVLSDCSVKIPVRWVPVGERLLDLGEPGREGLSHFALQVALWVRSLVPVNESGAPFEVIDPISDELIALARTQADDAAGVVRALVAGKPAGVSIFGDRLGQSPVFVEAVTHWVKRIHAQGVERTLKEFLG